MKTPLPWLNLLHDKRRTLAALSGVAFAIVLVFMQLGFYYGCATSATLVYNACDFDAIVLARRYVHLRISHNFPRVRLSQARGVPGVARTTPVSVAAMYLRNAANHITREVLVLGVNPDDHPFAVAAMDRPLPLLSRPDTAVVDRRHKALIDPAPVGTITELNGRRIKVVADYSRGTGLIADGSLLVSDVTFARLVGQTSLERVELGLVKFVAGADSARVLRQLRARLPADIQVLSRDELAAKETYFFLRIKPLGFLFTSGLYIGLLVGAVFLYQILSVDVSQRAKQYAMLKAIGYTPRAVYRLVLCQGLLLGALAYCPALPASLVIYAVVRHVSDLPMDLTLSRAALVWMLSVGMCALAGLLAVRKVNAADPADLF